jgi:hypothetical protein
MSVRQKACLTLLVDPLAKVQVRRFIRVAERWLTSIGHGPNFFGAKCPGFTQSTVSYSRAREIVEDTAIEHSEYLELLEMPPNNTHFGDAPVNVSLKIRYKQLAVFAIDTSVYSVDNQEWISLARDLSSVYPFVYGYTYVLPYDVGPGHYANGIVYQVGVGRPRHEEELRTRWGHILMSPASNPRTQILRQVYGLQFLSEGHLKREIDGGTLRQWIDASADRGRLSPLVDGIWTWLIDKDSQVLAANEALFAAGLLSAWDPQLAGIMST